MLLRTLTKTFLVVLLLSFGSISAQELSDDEIRQILINQSIRSYSGSCPCPYNTTRNGSRCGGRSAYSKPGGAEPLCYDRDVTDKMIEQYRARNKK
jgi:hypothetical protein